MRILGEIKHEKYKITILEMSSKISIQVEDGLLVQTYRFRDGGIVNSLAEAQVFCSNQFLVHVEENFLSMRKAQSERLQTLAKEQEDQFPKII